MSADFIAKTISLLKNIVLVNVKTSKVFLQSLLNSYSQIFFSTNPVFGSILFVVSFFDINTGFCGFLAVVCSAVAVRILRYDPIRISLGYYGFNSLLVGLGIGVAFSPGYPVYLLVITMAILTVLLSVTFEGIFGKYSLPFLSLPFLVSIWLLTLSARTFKAMHISERGVFPMNDLYRNGIDFIGVIQQFFSGWEPVLPLKVYFLSLAAIFFQTSFWSGVCIAIGLLIYSRIAFSVSIIGFFPAFFFYKITGATIDARSYSYIGFNYILISIAIGSFFFVASPVSYLSIILLVPITASIALATKAFLDPYNLSLLSLPFNVVVLLFIYALKLRIYPGTLMVETPIQHFSPEKNLYNFISNKQRLSHYCWPISLPFYGEWMVSQGHDGNLTHKSHWRYAWDFQVIDKKGSLYQDLGNSVENYYCFGKPVLAPADGIIEEVADGIGDNRIGETNLNQNWGNTVVIRHGAALFSKLCHLKAGSIPLKKGAVVKKGQRIGSVGNSGNSPIPHLHFQLQAHPYIGSATIKYPISYYTQASTQSKKFIEYDYPKEHEIVANVETDKLLKKAFAFSAGQQLQCKLTDDSLTTKQLGSTTVSLEIESDIYNTTFIRDPKNNAVAYFFFDDTLLYFKNYIGPKSTFLHYLFLSLFKAPMYVLSTTPVIDHIPPHLVFQGPLLWLQDFCAPFFMFLRADFSMQCTVISSDPAAVKIEAYSQVDKYVFSKKISSVKFYLAIGNKGIEHFRIVSNKKTVEALFEGL